MNFSKENLIEAISVISRQKNVEKQSIEQADKLLR